MSPEVTLSNRLGGLESGATLPPRVRQALPAGAAHIGQSKTSAAVAGSASSAMSQNLSQAWFGEGGFARGFESDARERTGHCVNRGRVSRNYSFMRSRTDHSQGQDVQAVTVVFAGAVGTVGSAGASLGGDEGAVNQDDLPAPSDDLLQVSHPRGRDSEVCHLGQT